jgi:hypothetical protein
MDRPSGVEDLDVLLVDGDNLLHDVRGSRDEGGVAWLLPRLRGWRPDHLHIIVGLDGHPPPSEPRRKRATKGIDFHHSGSRSADDLLIAILQAQPYAGRARTAVVTRDRGLQERARRAGGATRSVDWLMRLVAGGANGAAAGGPRASGRPVSIGQGKAPPPRHFDPPPVDESERPWQPGRGATRKKGNPRRKAKDPRQR